MAAPSPSSPRHDAPLGRRFGAVATNLVIVALCGWAAEIVAASFAPASRSQLTVVASVTFGALVVAFWACCGLARRSPGMIACGLYLIDGAQPDRRAPVSKALLRSAPFLLLALVVSFPAEALGQQFIPIRLIAVLVVAMSLGGNASPLWSGKDRRTFIDQKLGLRVVRATRPG